MYLDFNLQCCEFCLLIVSLKLISKYIRIMSIYCIKKSLSEIEKEIRNETGRFQGLANKVSVELETKSN